MKIIEQEPVIAITDEYIVYLELIMEDKDV